jgi:peptidoglycan/xylan/chitin deacetylase (PgdA/CDA1 family)
MAGGRHIVTAVHKKPFEKLIEVGSSAKKASSHIGLRLPGVPIFNYHGLAESAPQEASLDARPYWIPPTQFRSQLAHIREVGFEVILMGGLKERSLGPTSKLRAVVLTFDDGLVSDYEIAFPLLVEFGQQAVFFLNTATVGKAGYLEWSQIAEMQRGGMSFQSHSHRHVDLTVLPGLTLDAELTESKQRLEDRLGSRVDFLAAPHGVLDRRVLRHALAVGYSGVCSTRCWPARPGALIVTRITLRRDVEIGEFHGFLSGKPWPYARRLSRGVLHRPQAITSHLWSVLRHRWLKQPVPVSK